MKILCRLTAVLAAMVLMAVFLPVRVFGADTRLVIYHTNDIHGRAEGSLEKEEEGSFRETGSIGFARYKQMLDGDRANGAIDAVLALDAGDAVHGTLFAQLSSGEDMIDLMRMVGIDAMACGNHEFGFGQIQLKELEGRAAAKFPLMAANIDSATTGTTFFKVNHKVLMAGGKKIVVFGITTPETKEKAHANFTRGLSFGAGRDEQDPDEFVSTVQAIIDALPPADLVIMLGHLGVEEGSPFGTDALVPGLSGLDLVIDGHSHSVYKEKIRDRDQKEVLVVQAGNYFENVGRIEIIFDGGGLAMEAETIPFRQVRHLEGDAAILARIEDFNENKEAVLVREIGRTATRLVQSGEREGESVALVRLQETNLGNLVADSMRRATGADIAMTNGGGIRADIEAGTITWQDALAVLPFGNLITVIEVSGRQILDALIHGAKDYPAANGGFLQVSGLSYVIVTQEQEGRQAYLDIDRVMVDGKPLEPDKIYTLATNDFLVAGGDGFTMFEGARQVLLGGLMLEALIDEIEVRTRTAGGEGFTCEVEGRVRVMNRPEGQPPAARGEWVVRTLTGAVVLTLTTLVFVTGRRKTGDR